MDSKVTIAGHPVRESAAARRSIAERTSTAWVIVAGDDTAPGRARGDRPWE